LIIWKESLNSDGANNKTTKKRTTYVLICTAVEDPVTNSGWDPIKR
jgi:hypothetical protein